LNTKRLLVNGLKCRRLGLETLYEKAAGEKGWFGPTFDAIAEEDKLKQILAYNEAEERVLVGRSRDACALARKGRAPPPTTVDSGLPRSVN
jgi:hypothetical protein